MSHDLEREPGMVQLSDLVIYNPQVGSFEGLLQVIAKAADEGARFVNFDIKPDFPDTPRNWQKEIERVFALGGRYLRGQS
ncbi:MAG: sulfur relay protein DsrC [Hyphomicrobiaceae bacterium]|nr:sulfur relay protein DsrC [Hyphomicrobiaceae bacterium]MCC0009792.1 sulfur relay protein DsrC [Hyphomicrobiaceae bacterium]